MEEQISQETILKEIQARYPQEFLISVQAVRISALLNHMKECECEHCREHAGTTEG